MGFLTTFTVYNDSADQIEKNPIDFARVITEGTSSIQIDRGYNWDGVGNAPNMVILQKPRHMEDNTLYLHAGNTVVDVYNANSEWAIDTFINEMEYHLKRLKKLKKESKK